MKTEDRISREIQSEESAIWYISDIVGSKVVVKTTTATIKSIINGCKTEFLFGKDSTPEKPVFHKGIRIYDDPIHHLSITGVNRHYDENTSLEVILGLPEVFIHFYNEHSILQAFATLTFTDIDKANVLKLLGNTKQLYEGDFNPSTIQSLNSFDYSLNRSREFEGAYEIETLVIEGTISNCQIMENHFFGVNEDYKIVISDTEETEGEILERQVWLSLESLFEAEIYKNARRKNNKGELTDVFAFSERTIFLIESKSLSIFTEKERTMEKKVNMLQSHISKAIDQLVGASKTVKNGIAICTSSGEEIVFDRKLNQHCIVLVSDLFPFGDWKPIEIKMMKAMIDNGICLNIMD